MRKHTAYLNLNVDQGELKRTYSIFSRDLWLWTFIVFFFFKILVNNERCPLKMYICTNNTELKIYFQGSKLKVDM